MEVIKLRPHHSLCIPFFQGHGYNDEFVENMYMTIQKLKENPNIEITFGADTLCEKCPNLRNGGCANFESVKAHDKRVSDVCGFYDKQIMTAKEFFETAKAKIIDTGRLSEVCKECKWSHLCK